MSWCSSRRLVFRFPGKPGVGEPADHYNIYRNGTLLRTVTSAVAPVIDNPPRGIMSYVVTAADVLGNAAASPPTIFQLLVGAVNNLQALVTTGQVADVVLGFR